MRITRLAGPIALLTLLLVLIPAPSFGAGGEGGKEGHGGDAYSQEFFSAAMSGLETLRSTLGANPTEDAMEKELHTVRVTSEPTLSLHGLEVDFISYPDQDVLVISRKAWDKLSTDKARMDFAITRIQSITQAREGAQPLEDALNSALAQARAARLALRKTGAALLDAYIDLDRRALTLDRDEYLAGLKPISESRQYKKCMGYHLFITKKTKQVCGELTEMIRAVPSFQRVYDRVSAKTQEKEDQELADYLKALPADSPEKAAFSGWVLQISTSFENNLHPIARIFDGFKTLNENCYSPALLQPPTSDCFMNTFAEMISGNQASAIEQARWNFESEAKIVSDEIQRFVNE